MKTRGYRLVLALFGALPAFLASGTAFAAEKPDVVLIILDDLGYGDFGCYGCTDIKTPHIDRLARQGVRMTDFYSNGPVCTPTRAALMTGRYQQRVGLEWAISPGQKEPGLDVEDSTLARGLKRRGYATALYGKWHLGYRPECGPLAHGFDEFFGLLSPDIDNYSHREINGAPDLYEGDKPVEREGYMTDLITARAVSFVEKHAAEPFFLEVAYNAVHWPFQRPDRPDDVRTLETWYDGKREDYAKMLERVDDGVGAILRALEKKGLTDRTLVIVTNDNGGEQLSRGTPLRGGKGILLEGGIRVPCIFRWPGRLPANKVSSDLAITMDLTATILAAAGAKPPGNRALDGIDLTPILRGETPAPDRTFFWRIDPARGGQWAARYRQWKYIRYKKGELLFNLDTDLGDQIDLSERHPEIVDDFRDAVENWEAEMAESRPKFLLR